MSSIAENSRQVFSTESRPSFEAPHAGSLTRALLDRYRCPSELLRFGLAGPLDGSPGFFRVGSETTVWGRTTRRLQHPRFESCETDILSDVRCEDGTVVLPFDPDEVIDNLRLERYPGCRLSPWERAMKHAYYCLRPLTGLAARSGVQKLRAHRWQSRAFPQWPLDTSVDDLCETLLLLAVRASGRALPFIWFWPRGASAAVCITHDVETTRGRDFCESLADIDESFGIRPSWQIVPEQRYQVSDDYLHRLRSRGGEICVQDLNHDGRLFDSHRRFLQRAEQINRYARLYRATGFRAGVLYRNPDWLHALDFSYDMSTPTVARLDPQRGGCCTTLPYFIGKVLELPVTTIQDYSLFHVLNQFSIDLWKTQLAAILARNGLASFIVHPDYIIDSRPQATYRQLLTYLTELRSRHNLWFALPGDIDRWWRARSAMSLVREGNTWRVVGDGSEHASVAFAREVDGRLVCDREQPGGPAPA